MQLPGNGPTGLLLLRVMQELWAWERFLFIHSPPDEQLRVLGIEFMVHETILTFSDLSFDMIINKLVCVFLNSYF